MNQGIGAQKMETSILTKKQTKEYRKNISYDGEPARIKATVRYDDDCGNGHNSFAITGEIWQRRRGVVTCGCIHDEIAKHFPKLKPFIKWHLMSSDGPMHYVANSLYHASTKDCHGCEKGEPWAWDHHIKFGDHPITQEINKKFREYLQACRMGESLKVVPVEHRNDGAGDYKFGPKYTFTGYVGRWHECPFDTEKEALAFAEAWAMGNAKFIDLPSLFGEGKEADLDGARSCAIWPDAELEDFTKENLEARLPQLLLDFQADLGKLDLIY